MNGKFMDDFSITAFYLLQPVQGDDLISTVEDKVGPEAQISTDFNQTYTKWIRMVHTQDEILRSAFLPRLP